MHKQNYHFQKATFLPDSQFDTLRAIDWKMHYIEFNVTSKEKNPMKGISTNKEMGNRENRPAAELPIGMWWISTNLIPR